MATPFRSKLVKVQSICLSFNTIVSEPLVDVGVALSDAIRYPIEIILLRLLTIIASCMGVNAHCDKSNVDGASNPVVYYCNQQGPALRLLKKPFREIEEKEAQKWVTQHGI